MRCNIWFWFLAGAGVWLSFEPIETGAAVMFAAAAIVAAMEKDR